MRHVAEHTPCKHRYQTDKCNLWMVDDITRARPAMCNQFLIRYVCHCASSHSTTRMVAPSMRFCLPPVTTRSPSFNPASTVVRDPTNRPSRTGSQPRKRFLRSAFNDEDNGGIGIGRRTQQRARRNRRQQDRVLIARNRDLAHHPRLAVAVLCWESPPQLDKDAWRDPLPRQSRGCGPEMSVSGNAST